ncbi:MAG TPA: hypothetical protein VMZ03_14620 [Chitinophagaceae bacterium]|nr:hypothetical protein [Chitinophagaceae bacterium]
MNLLVPPGTKGKSVDLEQTFTATMLDEAKAVYEKAVKRLQQPSSWHKLTGDPGAVFTVKDPSTMAEKKSAAINDLIKIDLPAPGSPAGDGHDWVKVEKISRDFDEQADESFGLLAKVTENPEDPEKGIAHFFAEGASSTFIIKRKGSTVTASYHGRNETPNTENPGLADKVRNTIVALGALAGISELQWKALLKGFIDK